MYSKGRFPDEAQLLDAGMPSTASYAETTIHPPPLPVFLSVDVSLLSKLGLCTQAFLSIPMLLSTQIKLFKAWLFDAHFDHLRFVTASFAASHLLLDQR